jgi:predicted  nucleic acid-binding Zn-ribbon protein
MKSIQLLAVLVIFSMMSCTRSGDHSTMNHDSDQTQEEGPNQALYNQMMDVHDEVMPRMDEIMKLKRQLQEEIANSPDMVVERKQELENIISNLDSASNSMMTWMHRINEFNPLADSVNQEKAREYLESEMEEIKKVKELMIESIDKAKTEAEKK